MNKASILLIFIIMSVITVQAQQITQTLRGKVVDAATSIELVGATVSLDGTDYGVATDEFGAFRFEELSLGRYTVRVSYLGYETIIVPEILLESSKEIVKVISLKESSEALETVVVTAENRSDNVASIQEITIEQVFRYAATFYDPARLATSFAGVASDNDQGNNIVVRGNSPNTTVWRLEGVDIVNPNHTPNAGTFSDRVTQGGGGVNILSAQMLGNSSFITGAFSPEYGNVLGGLLDMNFRKGNNEQFERTFQFGIIGIDLAAEGPLLKNGKSSFLGNLRYSTLGLLGAMGVNLGDEKIGFIDGSFNFSLPTKNAGNFTLFAVGGQSTNLFEGQRDTSVWEFQKDRFDIDFSSNTAILGGTHQINFSKNTSLKTVLVWSALLSSRVGDRLDNDFNATRVEEDDYYQSRLSFRTTLTQKLGAKAQLNAGLLLTDMNYDIQSTRNGESVLSGEGGGQLIQPFANLKLQPTSNFSVNLGLHYLYFTFNQTNALEPRLSFKWQTTPNQSLVAAYGLHSQLQLPTTYFFSFTQADGSFTNPNQGLDFTKAHHFVLGYNWLWNNSSRFKVETYYQSLFNIPIVNNSNRSFSLLNELEGFITEPLENVGTGLNYGLEMTYQKYLNQGIYLLVASSLYQSKYRGGDGILRDTRFNGNYMLNATLGKESQWTNKKQKERVLGLNAKMNYVGGRQTTPINITASQLTNTTVFEETLAYSIKQRAYFKVDFRVYLKTNKPKYTHTWSLDIQNITNQQNIAFDYFDTEKGEIVSKYQLGLIPILNWRIEF